MDKINCKLIILIFCLPFFTDLHAQQANADKFRKGFLRTVLSVHLKGREQLVFNTADGPLKFKNNSLADSFITRHIYIDKPTHLSYNNVIIKTTGEVYESGNLLLFPGDSVVLENDGHTVSSSDGLPYLIDRFLTIPLLNFPVTHQNLLRVLDSAGLQTLLENTSNNYKANEKRISDLPIDLRQKSALRHFNYILQARQICDIPFDKIKKADTGLFDSAYADLLLHVATMDSISSGFCNPVYDHLIQYNVFRKGLSIKDFWLYFDKADSTIVTNDFYQPYLISRLEGIYKNSPGRLEALVSDQKGSTHVAGAVDTLYELASILLQTKSNYKAAKSRLDQYANGKYAFLLSEEDELHREQRTIQSLAPLNLLDFNDKKVQFQKLLNDGTTNIIVLDFWASWCVPCIADYPNLKKVKAALKNQSIRFISISIDAEEDKDAWIKRTKQLQTFHASDQYRLENPKHSPVNQFFNLNSIPRYIVIDKDNKILEEDFIRPNEPAFQRKLEGYLRAALLHE